MSYYALTDSDWPWDDEHEGRAVVVHADSPEEAVKVATEKHLKEFPGAGGITWKVARLNLVGFQDASWEDDNQPTFEVLTYYSDGINGPPDRAPLPESAFQTAIMQQAPHVLMRPQITADGDMWCALYGRDIAEGVCGFGRTPKEACEAFDRQWNEGLTPKAAFLARSDARSALSSTKGTEG